MTGLNDGAIGYIEFAYAKQNALTYGAVQNKAGTYIKPSTQAVQAAMAEMLGKSTGCSKGKGGSMHFTDPSVGLLGANAIVAGGVPHAAGAALASQLQNKDNIAMAYFGEGTVNQGFLESLNLAVI
jgi:TPP-dependent pyruvate/acetoin dehydrogenase alpha subunit